MAHYDPENYNPRDSLGYLLKTNQSLIHDCLEKVFATQDINFMQWIALLKLSEGSALTASDLCREMRHDNGALTRMLDQLEGLGYLERKRSLQDRRVVDLQITDAGRLKVKDLTPKALDNMNAALAPLSTEEFVTLTGLLKKLKTCLEDYSSSQTAPS